MRQKAEAGSRVAQSTRRLLPLRARCRGELPRSISFLICCRQTGCFTCRSQPWPHVRRGTSVPENIPEAIRLYEGVGRTASGTDAFAARIKLGRILSRGIGIPVDVAAALQWYSAAIELVSDDEDSDNVQEARANVAQAGK
jgi:hypothetical protein